MIEDISLITTTAKGTMLKSTATVEYKDDRIWFLRSPFSLKDEIKAMQGSKWHGFDKEPRKVWSVADTHRNRFQLEYMKGENPYEWFDRPIQHFEYPRKLMAHQKELADIALTYHYQIWAAEMRTGKTLAAISVMEMSGVKDWVWVGPKTTLHAIRFEFEKWNMDKSLNVNLMTYDGLESMMADWNGDPPCQGLILDESSKCKNGSAKRSIAAQKLADLIRSKYKMDGYVLLMTGTPAPKTPVDWWSQAEIAWPGFLKEGSAKALESRLAFFADVQLDMGPIKKRIGWKDNELKCDRCGNFEDHECHQLEVADHVFKPSFNEVSYLYERLKGLVTIKHKKDCLDLPEKEFVTIRLQPSKATLRVAKAIVDTAPNTITGLTLLRELSDGFQYREEANGTKKCDHCQDGKVTEWYDDSDRTYRSIDMLDPSIQLQSRQVECPKCGGTCEMNSYTRTVKMVPTPKQEALEGLLEKSEDYGRIVIFAGFTGSVDRCAEICTKNGWDVVRCDGRGFAVRQYNSDGEMFWDSKIPGLAYWADRSNERVAFVSHPESGGMGIDLSEAPIAVFWSNSFKPEYRIQAMERIHGPRMNRELGATIYDLVHLPTDERVLDVIKDNRRIEKMTLGEIANFETF